MKSTLAALALTTLALTSLLALDANASPVPETLSKDVSRDIASRAIDLIDENYVIEDKAHDISEALRAKLEAGDFDIEDPTAFATALSVAMREISNDLHMSFRLDPERHDVLLTGSPDRDRPSSEQVAYYENQARQANYGYKSVQFLPGNIGYINLTGFWDGDDGDAKVRGAMALLHGADALIIDVRENGGGSAEAVRLLQSYFFEKPTHVLTFHNRSEGIADKSKTAKRPKKHHMGDVPLYVLTSRSTGSAAEDFSYIMKAHGKATLVGSRTAGAGHTVAFYSVAPAFVIGISSGRPISPVTGAGWEGVGVEPDVDVDAAEALNTATMLAFQHLITKSEPDADISAWEWGLSSLEGKANPPTHTVEELDAMTGTYGARVILRKGDTLYYTRDGRPEVALIPLTETLFEHSVISDFRLRFIFKDDEVFNGNPAVVLEALFANGRRERDPRTSD